MSNVQIIITAAAPVLSAVMCWALYLSGRHAYGNAGLAFALLQLYSLAVLPIKYEAKPAPPQSVAYVAGNMSDVYHDEKCPYAQKLIRPVAHFASEAEALLTDRRPCQRCIYCQTDLSRAPIATATRTNPSPARK